MHHHPRRKVWTPAPQTLCPVRGSTTGKVTTILVPGEGEHTHHSFPESRNPWLRLQLVSGELLKEGDQQLLQQCSTPAGQHRTHYACIHACTPSIASEPARAGRLWRSLASWPRLARPVHLTFGSPQKLRERVRPRPLPLWACRQCLGHPAIPPSHHVPHETGNPQKQPSTPAIAPSRRNRESAPTGLHSITEAKCLFCGLFLSLRAPRACSGCSASPAMRATLTVPTVIALRKLVKRWR